MQTYYTVDVCHTGHWYQWDLVTTRGAADELFAKYIEDDTFDDVAITLHTSCSALQLRSKNDEEDLPW